MADDDSTNVRTLPTAAKAPVLNHRRRGSYGKKVASFYIGQKRRLMHAAESRALSSAGDTDREMIAVLRCLLYRAVRGKLDSLVTVFREQAGSESQCCIVGGYKKRRLELLRDVSHLQIRLVEDAADNGQES